MAFRPGDSTAPVLCFRLNNWWVQAWLLLWIAAAGAVCVAQQANLGPHDIGGRGCMACHTVTTDPSGQVQYAWAGDLPLPGADTPMPQADEGWSHSYRCLSCHDGVMAQVMDMGAVGPENRPKVSGPHPINVRYKSERGSLFPTQQIGGEWRLIANPENPFTNLKLFRRNAFDATPTVQCASCHDPHDHRNAYFLRDAYDQGYRGTKFCRTCHAEESAFAALP